MKLFRVTLLVKIYGESNKSTTEKRVIGVKNVESFDVIAVTESAALVQVDVAGYAARANVLVGDVSYSVQAFDLKDFQPGE